MTKRFQKYNNKHINEKKKYKKTKQNKTNKKNKRAWWP